jgi:hypothetical protein
MESQNVLYVFSGALLSHVKEWNTNNRHYNVDDPWKHYAKYKKPVTKDHILYDHIFMKWQNSQS